VVDFFAASARLVVGVDGSVHRRPGEAERDAARQAAIERAYRVRFVRLSAEIVETDISRALEIIRAALGGLG
jgi:very-short-patch-repair endonuclease